MDIEFYSLLFYFIISIVQSNNISTYQQLYHITDYILSFNTYHFEWNKHQFTTTTFTQDDRHRACTIHIPSLCIEYTSTKSGFVVHLNDTSFDFMNDNDWTQINYIHTPQSLALYHPNALNEPHLLRDAVSRDEDVHDDTDDLDPFQSPNPHYPGRRLLRSRARCRVYLYKNSRFSRRKGGTFRRRRYTTSALKRKGFRGGRVRSVKVRGSRCCTARLYSHNNFRGKRVRFKRGSYSRIRRRKHRIENLGSMKVYCSSRRGRRRRSRRRRRRRGGFGRGLRRFGKFMGRGIGALAGHLQSQTGPHPIPILLGPMTGMLGHFGYSMHPIMPPSMAMQHTMMGHYGGGMGMPMMSHPMYGHPTMGHGTMPFGNMAMGGMGMNGMGGMGMHPAMMGGMGHPMMGGMGHPMMGGMGHPMTGGMGYGMGGYGMGMGHPMMGGMGSAYGMNMMHPQMGSAYGMSPMNGQQIMDQPGVKTPVVHVYTDSGTDASPEESEEEEEEAPQQEQEQQIQKQGGQPKQIPMAMPQSRRRMMMQSAYMARGIGLKKCVVMGGGEICGTFYFGQSVIALDYTVKRQKLLRIDEDDEGEEMIDDEDVLLIEYIEEEESQEEEDVLGMDENKYDAFLIQHEDYGLVRNERIFGMDVDEEMLRDYTDGLTDTVNTVSWLWSKHGCNQHMIQLINMSVCTMHGVDKNEASDIMIYGVYDEDVDEVEDEWEVDEFEMNVRDPMDWDEIYYINMFRENKINNRKVCKVIAMIKVCAEVNDDQYLQGTIKEMLISIEFL